MAQLTLFDSSETLLADDERGRIAYTRRFVDPDTAAAWFAELRSAVPWQAHRRVMYEREVDVPRLIGHFRLDPAPGSTPAAILEAARRVCERLGAPFNSVGLNLYRDGRDSVAPHNDHLNEIRKGFPIALVSLGATRRMTIRAKAAPRRLIHVDLEPGSLLVMDYATQLHYTHAVPKTNEPVGERISLAFRVKPARRSPAGAGTRRSRYGSDQEVSMTVATSTVLGRPLWYELMTTDMKAAEAFYSNVVGWRSAPFAGSPQPYTTFARSGGVPIAGVMTRPDDVKAPPFWAMYVGVPKLEAAAAHITKLGGRACSPVIEVPTVGRMQMMTDPQGAAFYIYEPASTELQPEGAAEMGEASWHELMTTDAPAALKFYTEVFGWQPSETLDMGPMGKYHMFNRPHGMIGGMMNKPPEMADVPPNWQIYFRVADINAAIERIKANGGQILNGPMEVPGGDWIVNAMDPQGAAFSLHARKAQ